VIVAFMMLEGLRRVENPDTSAPFLLLQRNWSLSVQNPLTGIAKGLERGDCKISGCTWVNTSVLLHRQILLQKVSQVATILHRQTKLHINRRCGFFRAPVFV